MMKRRSGQHGYSLIEALVVVAIVGVVSIVTVPNFISMYRASKVKSAVRKFTADIRDARQRAVTTHRRVMVSVGAQAGETDSYYVFEEIAGAWEPIEPSPRILEEATEDTTVFFGTTNFTDTDTTDGGSRPDVIFRQNGTVDPGSYPVMAGGALPTIKITTDMDIPKPTYDISVSSSGSIRVE